MPHTPVQGSGAHEPLLSREATSHSLTAMLVWSCRLQSVETKVLHVRLSRTAATVRGDHMTFLRGGGLERRKNSNIVSQEQTADPIKAGVFIQDTSQATTELTSMRDGNQFNGWEGHTKAKNTPSSSGATGKVAPTHPAAVQVSVHKQE